MARGAVTTDHLTAAGEHVYGVLKQVKAKPYVKVGVLGKDFDKPKKGDDSKKPASLGEVAVYNEFGTSDGRIPARSFIGFTSDSKREAWADLSGTLKSKVLQGGMAPAKALGIMGLRIQADIQTRIRSDIPPPNAPSTIARKLEGTAGLKGRELANAMNKAFDGQGTLRNTGQLLNSIAWELGWDWSKDK